MNRVSCTVTIRQVVRDTFRQALASGICWMMLLVTAVCVLLCLSISVQGDVSLHGSDEPALFLPPSALVPGAGGSVRQTTGTRVVVDPELARREGIQAVGGQVSMAFGALTFPVSRERRDAIQFLELLLADGFAGTLGVLLALVWTAGFVPAFLEPGAASVLLAKPVERWHLLVGKYLGVLTFVAFHITLFVGLTWLALGVRTHVWNLAYWWSVPLLCLQFATFYSVSVLLGVTTRGTAACVFGSVLFWLLSWGINYGSVMGRTVLEPRYAPVGTIALSEVAYWISPKPIDASLILFNALDAQHHFQKPAIFTTIESRHDFSPCLSILSSLLLGVSILGLSCREFAELDY